MEEVISVFQFREELGTYHYFELYCPEPSSPIGFSGRYQRAYLNINDAYLGLAGQDGTAWIRNIQTAEKIRKVKYFGISDYTITCLDRSNGSPVEVQICLTCSNS